MPRPFWSGQIRISLVSFGINLFPATESKGEIHFHQLNRKTGERIRHQNVSDGDEPIDKDEIVKGYEYTKGEFVMIEQKEIDTLRIPSRQVIDATQFIDTHDIHPEFFEKPYFVTPESASQAEAFAVVRKALQDSKKAALGKIAFGGREHLIAISAPEDDKQLGMMAYTLRYSEELRDPADYFADIKPMKVDEDQLALAKELIQRKTSSFAPEQFTDDYESALRAMVQAKIKHLPLPEEKDSPKPTKVINLMDALRKSISGTGSSNAAKAGKKTAASGTRRPPRENKLTLVTPSKKASTKPSKPTKKRRSA